MDSNPSEINTLFAKDVFGYSLDYYENDYTAINGATPLANVQNTSHAAQNSADLYNGNIRYMQTALTNPLDRTKMPMLNAYKYDQLNRLKESRSYESGLSGNTWNPTTYNNAYYNAFTYDAMGNILTQERHNRAGEKFDDLEYHYQKDANGNLLRNRLYSVSDDSTLASVMEDDIEDMDAFISAVNQINTDNNYSYDAEGRLVKDRQEEIDTIIWTVSGKVKEIRRSLSSNKKNLIFDYNAMGNRIAKHVYDNQTLMLEKSTYYILDAQGNQLSMYEHIVDDADVKYYLTERNIYGSSRLGTLKDPVNMFNAKPLPSYGILGNRNYELSNHLGNVLTVISDIKYPLSDDNTTITGYEVGISNIFDYSPFGAPLDGRTIENIFHQEEITDTSTVLKTIYVLEETFDVASDWQAINSHTEITYPSGRMRVRNSASTKKTIGAEKDFTTGTGQHAVSFEIASLPTGMNLCQAPGGVIMGAQYNEASDTLVGTGNYQIQSVSPHYVVVEIRNENNALVLKDSTNSTGTYSYAFSAPQGKEYTISFHNKSMCANLGYQIDNVFISYDTLEVVTGNTIIVSDTLFIINNDFENPVIEPNGAGVKIDGWTHYSPSTTLSVEPHNGSDWLKVVSTNGTHGAHQGFSVEPGETYTFEIDLHRPSGMNNVINIVIWKNTGPSGAYTLHVLNTDGSNTFNYTATSSNIYIQIRQAGTYYLDNIKMYRTYQDTVFVGGFDVDMAYRYGYNTQERVDEVSGKGNHYTAEFWEYSPRLGRRWNIDPVVKPWESGYAVMGNNPIWNIDPNGDDFINVHTKRKEAAKEKRDEAAGVLDAAKKDFEPFENMSRRDARKAGKLNEFKEARSNLNSAQKEFDRAESIYQQEVFYEDVVNQILEEFEIVNPEKFAEWSKFNPTGRGVIDIEVSAQNLPIQMLDNNGFPTGRTTTEGIDARIGSNNDYVKVRLQVVRVDGVVKIQVMTSDLVHGLGHVDGGKARDEDYAIEYEIKNYENLIKKE